MYTVLIVLVVIAAVLLGLAVLMQNSKGGGLSSTFGGTSQIMGVRKTTDFMEKATWVLAISIVVLSFVATFMTSTSNAGADGQQGSKAAQGGALTTMPMTTQPAAATTTEAAPAEAQQQTSAE